MSFRRTAFWRIWFNSMLGKLGKWLKVGAKVGLRAAPDVLAVVYPPAAGLVDMLVGQIVQAEADHGPGKGPEKKAQVMGSVRMGMLMATPLIERMSGREIDDEAFAEGAEKLLEGLVLVMNAMGQLPKKEKL
jgi:hypothetical protein